jgi:hypothetical protein
MEKLVVFCKICKIEIKNNLVKGLYSENFCGNWICKICYPKYIESRKMLTIQRMRLGGL